MNPFYTKYTSEQLDKIGNTIIFLIKNIKKLPKTKLLKLLYILDEKSIQRSGTPFLNLNYEVWKFGPVDKDIFIELSDEPTLLKNFIEKKRENDKVSFVAKSEFCDDEFSNNELRLLQEVVNEFGNYTAKELVRYTHKEGTLWHTIAKEKGVLEDLEAEKINATEFDIDLSLLIQHDKRKKQIYEEYQLFN